MTGIIANALRKRCTPHTGITPAQVAHAIGYARYTVDRWIQGTSGPSAEAVGALAQFFRSHGDDGFLSDCFALPIVAPVLAALDLWFLDGEAQPAPSGHAEFIRRRMGLSPHVTGDLRASACRNRGWVALEQSPIGAVTCWHHTKVCPASAKACRDWLLLHAAKISTVRRVVEIDGTIGEVAHDTADQAARAFDRLLQPPRRRSAWHVERMPITRMPAEFGDEIALAGMKAVASAYADRAGALRASTIHAVTLTISNTPSAERVATAEKIASYLGKVSDADLSVKLIRRRQAYGGTEVTCLAAIIKDGIRHTAATMAPGDGFIKSPTREQLMGAR